MSDIDTAILDMKVKSLAPWFGGKRNLAPVIVAELGDHSVYWEPFCGSMAVLLSKKPCKMETVNDLHNDLVNLARVVQDPQEGSRLYRMLRRTLMHEDIFTASDRLMREFEKVPLGEMDSVERAYHYFVVSWLGRNGTAGQSASSKGTYCVRFTSNGGHAAKRWQSACESIPAWRRRMRSVTILNRDGFGMLERIEDKAGTVIYLDPPYFEKSGKYLHDFDSTDHERLADLVKRFTETRVIVSYYAHSEVGRLYPGWTQRRIEVVKSLSNANKRGEGKKKATEVLLINGPSYTAEAAGLF
jgi:DNA adenine methylase